MATSDLLGCAESAPGSTKASQNNKPFTEEQQETPASSTC